MAEGDHRFRDSVGPLLLALAGAAIGLVILFPEWIWARGWHRPDAFDGPREAWFLTLAQARLWMFLACAQVAVMAALAVPAWSMVQRLKLRVRDAAPSLGCVALVMTAFVVVSGHFRKDFPFPGADAKIAILTGLGAVAVGIPALLVIWSVPVSSEGLKPSSPEKIVSAYVERRQLVDRALLILGLVVGSAILAAGALRNAVVVAIGDNEFPTEYVLIYGIFFTLVLAAVYTPAYLRLQALGNAIVEAAAPLPSAADDTWGDVYDKRTKLVEQLGLSVSLTGSFQAGLAILAPLLTSLIGTVFPDQ